MNIEERNKIFQRYSKLVPYSLKYLKDYDKDIENDCLQQGYLILLECIDKYYAEKPRCAFSTFAVKNLKWRMRYYIGRNRTLIKEPQDYNYRRNLYLDIYNKYGENPPAEIIRNYKLKTWILEYINNKDNQSLIRNYIEDKDIRESKCDYENIDNRIDVELLLSRYIRHLPEGQKEIILKKYFTGDYVEKDKALAQSLNISASAVSERKLRAYSNLRRMLKRKEK